MLRDKITEGKIGGEKKTAENATEEEIREGKER